MSNHDIFFDVQNVRVPKLANLPPRLLNASNSEKRFHRTAVKVDINSMSMDEIKNIITDAKEIWLFGKQSCFK